MCPQNNFLWKILNQKVNNIVFLGNPILPQISLTKVNGTKHCYTGSDGNKYWVKPNQVYLNDCDKPDSELAYGNFFYNQ